MELEQGHLCAVAQELDGDFREAECDEPRLVVGNWSAPRPKRLGRFLDLGRFQLGRFSWGSSRGGSLRGPRRKMLSGSQRLKRPGSEGASLCGRACEHTLALAVAVHAVGSRLSRVEAAGLAEV